jgi:hypothetical protein
LVLSRSHTDDVSGVDDGSSAIRGGLDPLDRVPDGVGEVVVDSGLAFASADPVRVRVRRRGRRYDISDDGGAVGRAGKPTGWVDLFARHVAAEGFNVNRRGVISVPAVEGRDIAVLARRLAATSRTAYLALIEDNAA